MLNSFRIRVNRVQEVSAEFSMAKGSKESVEKGKKSILFAKSDASWRLALIPMLDHLRDALHRAPPPNYQTKFA